MTVHRKGKRHQNHRHSILEENMPLKPKYSQHMSETTQVSLKKKKKRQSDKLPESIVH